MLRRVIALGELTGLPRASYDLKKPTTAAGIYSNTNTLDANMHVKISIWESMCATDRNLSLMLNVPPGTTRYAFPLNQSIWRDGQVSAQAFSYQLSDISALV